MRAKVLYAAVFVAFLLAVAATQWPASWFEGRLEQASGGRWSISGTEGTIWNGAATLLLNESADAGHGPDAGRWRAVQNVRWKARWDDVWRGRLMFDTGFEQGSALIAVSLGGMSLQQLDAEFPASILGGMISGPLGRYSWTGAVHARSPSFSCSGQAFDCSGEIELMWKNAGVTEIPGPALGSYRIHIVGEGPTLHFDLTTLAGRLQVVGNGEAGSRGLRFTGEAAATDADASLEAKLRALGRPGGAPGKYVIEYRDGAPS